MEMVRGSRSPKFNPEISLQNSYCTSAGPPFFQKGQMYIEVCPQDFGLPHPPKFGGNQMGMAGRGRFKKCHNFATHVTTLVGACLATGGMIFATGSDSVSNIVLRSCGCFCMISRAFNHGLKGPLKPKTYCDNSSFAILSFTTVLIVRSGPVWRQHLPTTVTTICDRKRHFPPLSSGVINRHKMSEDVKVAVTTRYDKILAVPFWTSPSESLQLQDQELWKDGTKSAKSSKKKSEIDTVVRTPIYSRKN